MNFDIDMCDGDGIALCEKCRRKVYLVEARKQGYTHLWQITDPPAQENDCVYFYLLPDNYNHDINNNK